MTVRRATVDDAEGIAKVHTASWQTAYRGVIPDEFLDAIDWRRRVERWRRNISEGTVYVATAEDSIAGFIAVGPARDDSGLFELYAIYLHPSSWGSGLADELVETALDSRKTLLWVIDDNPRARRFYERHGFVADGVSRVESIGGREISEVRYVR